MAPLDLLYSAAGRHAPHKANRGSTLETLETVQVSIPWLYVVATGRWSSPWTRLDSVSVGRSALEKSLRDRKTLEKKALGGIGFGVTSDATDAELSSSSGETE